MIKQVATLLVLATAISCVTSLTLYSTGRTGTVNAIFAPAVNISVISPFVCADSNAFPDGINRKTFVWITPSNSHQIVSGILVCGASLCRYDALIFINGNNAPGVVGYSILSCNLNSTTSASVVNSVFVNNYLRAFLWDGTRGVDFFITNPPQLIADTLAGNLWNGLAATTTATVSLVAAGNSSVRGTLALEQKYGVVRIYGSVYGLSMGQHGFHVHQNGQLGNGCRDAGGHFNPFGNNHSSPTSTARHVGDLGNIQTNSNSLPTIVNIYDRMISLDANSQSSVVGRAIVIHAGQDDLGLGGNAGSLTTGNAGSRVACGIITIV